MSLVEWYPQIRGAHVALVSASGALFALRGAAVLARRPWPMQAPWRRLSYAIDTLLLAAGATLWALLSLNPATSPWLATKLLLLVVYIVLGSLALKRGRTPAVRATSYAAALAVFLFIASVALRHDPAGMFTAHGPISAAPG